MTRGSTVDFPNDDPFFHNVFSLSQAASFDLGRYEHGISRSRTLDTTGIVKVFCDLHSYMSVVVMVLDHPYFASPEDDGRFVLDNVPPGTFSIAAWHEQVGSNTQTVIVEPGATSHIEFSPRCSISDPSIRPPRLLTRTLIATFTTSACVLGVVMVVVDILIERSVQSGVAGSLSAVQQVLSASKERRSEELLVNAGALTEQPILKAALDTYQSEVQWGEPSADLLATLQRETERLALRSEADLVAILDESGVPLAAGGTLSADWLNTNTQGPATVELRSGEHVVTVGDGIVRAQVVPFDLSEARIGWLLVAERLDRTFAERIAALAGTAIAIVEGGAVRTSSFPVETESILAQAWAGASVGDGIVTLRGESYAHRRILDQEAIDELWRCAGSDFDAELVQALVAVLPDIHLPDVPTPVDRLHLVSSGQGSRIEVSSWERAG